MKLALVIAGLLAAAPAHADRETIATMALTGAGRARAGSFDAAGNKDAVPMWGARVTLAFEDAPIAYPTEHTLAADGRLVPELLAGFIADDKHAEGMIGAGLRLEAQLANAKRRMRMGIYAAGRALVIGEHQDSAVELALGEFILLHGSTRIGWEGGAMLRPRPHAAPAQAKELDAMLQVYVGWAL